MDRAGDHGIGGPFAEGLCGTQHRYEFNSRIKAFVFEKAEFVGGQRRKAGIAYEIDCRDAHLDNSPGDVPISAEYGEASIASQDYITFENSE